MPKTGKLIVKWHFELFSLLNKDELEELRKEVEKMGTTYKVKVGSLEASLVEKKA